MNQKQSTRSGRRRESSHLGIIIAILYSTILNLRLPEKQHQLALPSLPLRHSNLINLLPHLIFESIFISQLSHSTLSSFGACLHLLKIPLLSTTYKYFNIGFKTEICKSLAFDLINYIGQFCLFYVLSKTSKATRCKISEKTIVQRETLSSSENKEEKEEEVIIEKSRDQGYNQGDIKPRKTRKNVFLMSFLVWIFISLMDGVFNFVFEKTLSPKIHSDVQEYIHKLELDQYFLLKSSGTTPPGEILRAIPPKDRTMLEHQTISPIINLPYFFSSASLISLPSDFILLDRLPMLSFNTKLHWVSGLILRRILNSTLAYFLKS